MVSCNNVSVDGDTTQNRQNKWTKILNLEITIFGLTNVGEKWSRKKYLEIP